MDNRIRHLCDFLNASHSLYHAVAHLSRQLAEAGYTRLPENQVWHLVPGGKYYLTRGGTALLAFRIPRDTPKMFSAQIFITAATSSVVVASTAASGIYLP